MFISKLIPPGGFPIPFLIFMLALPTIAILSWIGIIRSRKGTKSLWRKKDGFPGQITGATVTAKTLSYNGAIAKHPFLALHLSYQQDGRTVQSIEPREVNLAFVEKVRKSFAAYSRSTKSRNPKNGVLSLNIADPEEKGRAERTIARGGMYIMTLEEPIPIMVFKKGDQIDWQVA